MTPEALRRYFPDDLHHVEGFHREVAAHLPQTGRVLDLGCGANAELAPYRTATREVWGADFQAHSQLQHAIWFRQLGRDGGIPFPAGHFDLVTSVMVLEHVRDPAAFLREVARVLRPGGAFVGHTVSGEHYVTWVRRAFGLLPHSVTQAVVWRLYGRACEDTFPVFYRLNGERAIRRAGRPAGLSLVGLRRYADPGYLRFSRLTQALAVMADWSLEKVGAGLGRLYLTVTLRKEAAPLRRTA
jgi:SAM-dependent methyltransferase